MAIPSLQFTSPFPSTRAFPSLIPHAPKPFTFRATDQENPISDPDNPKPDSENPIPDSDSFENRLSKVRLRYRSGTGKKAEIRKSKKGSSSKGSNVYLPPVSLKEPVSGGLKVDFGFCPYSERVNGRMAMLGLTALLLVELATGKSVLTYHTPAVVAVQIYFVAAVSAVYVKYEKEKVSVWPETPLED